LKAKGDTLFRKGGTIMPPKGANHKGKGNGKKEKKKEHQTDPSDEDDEAPQPPTGKRQRLEPSCNGGGTKNRCECMRTRTELDEFVEGRKTARQEATAIKADPTSIPDWVAAFPDQGGSVHYDKEETAWVLGVQ